MLVSTLFVSISSDNKWVQYNSILIQGWRAYGVPTIRSDLPAPNTRRVGDTKVSTSNLLDQCIIYTATIKN